MSDVPHSLEAERSVLGAILIENAAYNLAAAIVDSKAFYRQAHGRIFAALTTLIARGDAADLVTLKTLLEQRGELEDVGGPAYVASLVDGVPRSTNVEHYARIVAEHARRRQLLTVARTLAEGAVTDEDLGQLVKRVTTAGQRVVADSGNAPSLPKLLSLRTMLATPQPPAAMRFEGMQPIDTRVMLAAQYKAGKTSLVNNVIASLVDEEPLLGTFAVRPIDGVVVNLDFEMSPRMGAEWLSSLRIRNDDRVFPLFMRGRAADVDLLTSHTRRAWARELKAIGAKYLIWDCARPLIDALGLDENKDAGRLLTAFDALLVEADIPEALLVQHMGHNGERARGDSRFQDWPDATWRLLRKDENPDSARFISAYGRDVNVPESELQFDQSSRRLSIVGGSRKDARTDAALVAVIDVLGAGALTGRAVWRELKESEFSRQAVDNALVAGVKTGKLLVADGPKRARIYRSGPVSGSVPSVSRNTVSMCPAAYIRRDTGTHHLDQPSVPTLQLQDTPRKTVA